MIPTLWIIASVTFFMVRFAPGGPFLNEREIPIEAKEAILAKYGLDKPWHEQYFTYLKNAVVLDSEVFQTGPWFEDLHSFRIRYLAAPPAPEEPEA